MQSVGITGRIRWETTTGTSPAHGRWWLDIAPAARFRPLIECNLARRERYRTEVVPYLRNRGVGDDVTIEQLVRLDLQHLAHALTVVFDADHETILNRLMPEPLQRVIRVVRPTIDHVGRELFGPLDFYLGLLRELAPRLGLDHVAQDPGDNVTEDGDVVFQSVQVVEALRQFDPDLAGVTIAKIYFADRGTAAARGCLELFQAAPRDGLGAQCYRHTLERLTNLQIESYEGVGLSLQPPICHLSIEAPDVETVHAIHQVVRSDRSGMLMPYVDRVVENPGDQSTNTKLSIRSRPDSPVYNKIIEVVHHRG